MPHRGKWPKNLGLIRLLQNKPGIQKEERPHIHHPLWPMGSHICEPRLWIFPNNTNCRVIYHLLVYASSEKEAKLPRAAATLHLPPSPWMDDGGAGSWAWLRTSWEKPLREERRLSRAWSLTTALQAVRDSWGLPRDLGWACKEGSWHQEEQPASKFLLTSFSKTYECVLNFL